MSVFRHLLNLTFKNREYLWLTWTTASAPAGTGAPVLMRTHSPKIKIWEAMLPRTFYTKRFLQWDSRSSKSSPVFLNIVQVAEHLTIICWKRPWEKPSYLEENFDFSIKCWDLFGEHFQTAQGACVVSGAVVGNHWSSPWASGASTSFKAWNTYVCLIFLFREKFRIFSMKNT